MEPPSLLPHVDEMIMEYLLFRGFTKSFQVFNAERKRDRSKGFDVAQVISQFLFYIQTYQVEAVMETWKFLTARFFHHLDASYAVTVQHLEVSLLRLYVVNAVKTGHREKAVEFFKNYANKLNATIPTNNAEVGDSWCRWFILPYIQHPESDPYFQVFFSKEWLEAFVTSFRNFLSLIFRNLPLPKLLTFQLTRLEEPSLKLRLKVSQSECNRLRVINVEANARIKKLEEAGRQLHSMLRVMVQQSYLDHFVSDSDFVNNGRVDDDKRATTGYAPQLSPRQMQELGGIFGIEERNDMDNYRIAETALNITDLLPVSTPDDDIDSSLDSGSPVVSPSNTPMNLHNINGSDQEVNGQADWAKANLPSLPSCGQASLVQKVTLPSLENDSDSDAMQSTIICSFSSGGEYVAAARPGSSQIKRWSTDPIRADTLSAIPVSSKLLHFEWFWSPSYDEFLLYALDDGTVILRNIHDDADTVTVEIDAEFRTRQISCAKRAPVAALLSYSHKVLVLDRTSGGLEQRQLRTEHKITCVALSGTLLAGGSEDGCIQLLSSNRDVLMCKWRTSSDNGAESIAAVCYSSDGSSLLSLNTGGSTVIEWSIAECINDNKTNIPPILCTYDLGDYVEPATSKGTIPDWSIRFHPGGDHFVVVLTNCIRLFKRGVREAIKELIPMQESISYFDWHPTRPICCTTSNDNTVILWDFKDVI